MDGASCLGKQTDHLFCSEDGSLHIIDIPLSIALSQHLESNVQSLNKIASVSAPTEPYASTEPNSEKARANLLDRIDAETLERNERNAAFVCEGLHRIKELHSGPWLSARFLDPTITALNLPDSRNREDHTKQPRNSYRNDIAVTKARPQKILNLDHTIKDTAWMNSDLRRRIVYNPTNLATRVVAGEEHVHLNIPPCSAFYVGKIIPSSIGHFLESAKALYPEPSMTAAPGQFDIILMDPPWPNRSIARGRHYSVFDQRNHNQDTLAAINSMLPQMLAPNGVLAVWVTNKASTNQRVVQIFEENGIEMIEEWIWLKVTSNGEPVLPINGMYRQPWETCLVGRRNISSDDLGHEVKRKLIVACPELHSRKPWIGSMLAEVYGIQQPGELRKLEIFARCVTASWCAWGDEATKFNDNKWWQQSG
ncbi:MAG: hypothetical protein GOMPHAMPRED_000527 [Gomphillus americanus]|uniref:MT-A70-domain-containing protein n=1 Tax=Gomphillus americanus TaxID=1940652 RepID=A0A8H3EFM6_9LECA|nr:MAG: hypothetical protein GOMPHAMPRED_000527 [Gomphillus americanus]